MEKTDDYTVLFTFEEPWPIFLQDAAPPANCTQKNYIEEHGSEYFAENPVGAGPFKLVSAALDEEIVMERFDDYYGGSPEIPPVGPAHVDTAIFQIIPETSTRIAALQAGDVHIISNVPTHMVDQLEADPNIAVKTCTGTNFFSVSLDMEVYEPFKDVRVRKALNHAVDVDEIIATVMDGLAIRCPVCIPVPLDTTMPLQL